MGGLHRLTSPFPTEKTRLIGSDTSPDSVSQSRHAAYSRGVLAAVVRDCALAALSVLILLGLCEFGLRVSGVHYNASFFTQDADLGWALRPGARGWQTYEGENYVRINKEGFNDVDHAVQKPPDTVRIIFLGSSFTESVMIAQDKTFMAVVRRELEAQGHFMGKSKVEVFNFGVDSYNLAQDLINLRKHGWKYQPDLVVSDLAFSALNETRKFAADSDRPCFALEGNRLVLDKQSREHAVHYDADLVHRQDRNASITNNLRLYLMIIKAQQNFKRQLASLRGKAPRATPVDLPKAFDYLPPSASSDLQLEWDTKKAILRLMRDETAAHGAQFWIVTQSMSMQVHPDPAVRAQFEKENGLTSLYNPEMRVEEFARAEGIPYSLLAPRMAQYAESHHVALHGFYNTGFNSGHWNELGHEIAGEAIASDFVRFDDLSLSRRAAN